MLDLRFDPAFCTAKALIERGEIGEIRQIAFQGQHPLLYNERARWYFEKGKHGGVINDIAIHGIDMIRYLCGLSPKKVLAAKEWNAYAEDAPHFLDSGVFMCETEGGAVVTADVSYASPNGMRYSMPTYWEFRIWGRGGMLTFGKNLQEITLYRADAAQGEKIEPQPIEKTMLRDFLDCIEKKGETILSTKEALEATDITLKIRKHAHM
jgi:predicted dehydrogenase